MLTFPKYETYQDSNISWLQDIPGSWKIERAKWLFNKMERPVRPEDEVVTAFRDGQVTLRKNRREEGFTNALQEHGYQGIRKGDLVIHAMDAFAGAIGVSDSDGKSTPVYSVCIPRGEFYVNNHYYAYLLRYMALSGFIQSLAKGIRERSTDFRFNDFANLCLPIPSKEEQDRIVEFLDRKTSEIDQAIAQKQHLIELLQEQKAILINQAVTKGLNPNNPMRDSGVEWIGEIPEHWTVTRLKRLFLEIDDRSTDGSETLLSLRMYAGLVPHDDVSDKPIEDAALVGYKRVYPGQIVMNRMRAAIGLFGVATDFGIVSPDYAIFRPIKNLRVEYYLNLFKTESLKRVFFLESKGLGTGSSGFLRLYSDNFGMIKVPFPPLKEQSKICNHIQEIRNQFSEALEKVDQETKLLKELKSIFISQAVTGKMKV